MLQVLRAPQVQQGCKGQPGLLGVRVSLVLRARQVQPGRQALRRVEPLDPQVLPAEGRVLPGRLETRVLRELLGQQVR